MCLEERRGGCRLRGNVDYGGIAMGAFLGLEYRSMIQGQGQVPGPMLGVVSRISAGWSVRDR